MLRYTLKRFLSMLVTLFLVATVTFFLMHAVPGQPFELTRETPDSVRQALEAKLGLDKPLIEQYFIYMRNLLRGDFGISMKYKGQSVIGEVTSGMPISAVIGFGGVLVGCIIGAVLGAVAALKNKGAVDYIVIILAILGVSVPNFVFGSLIQRYFAVEWKLFPIQGWKTWQCAILPIMRPPSQTSPITRGCSAPACWMSWGRTTSTPPAAKGFLRHRSCAGTCFATPFCRLSRLLGQCAPAC